jgi:hypothetical protein
VKTRVGGALRALLGGVIDYAGLFPPARLDLPAAVGNYAAYARGRMKWMLGRLVVPASQLQALVEVVAAQLPPRATTNWRVAAILSDAHGDDLARVAAFNLVHAGARGALVDVVEAKVPDADAVYRLTRAVPEGIGLVCEVPSLAGCGDLFDAVRAVGGIAKARLGGPVASAIPSAEAIAGFLLDAARRGLRVKATAGLHHALRGEWPLSEEPHALRAPMHGFLNVLLAGALARASVRDPAAAEGDVVALLERRSADGLAVRGSTVSWAPLPAAGLDDLRRLRSEFLVSVGSCSFEEPVDDLRQLGLVSA